MKIFLAILFLSFTSCDILHKTSIQPRNVYIVNNDSVKISATYLISTLNLTYQFYGNDFIINNKILVEIEDNKVINSTLYNYINNETRKEKGNLNVETNSKYSIKVKFQKPLNSSKKVMILPSNYITCNGKRVINDTLLIDLN